MLCSVSNWQHETSRNIDTVLFPLLLPRKISIKRKTLGIESCNRLSSFSGRVFLDCLWPRRLLRSSRPPEIFQPPQQGFFSVHAHCPVTASRKDFSAVHTSPHPTSPQTLKKRKNFSSYEIQGAKPYMANGLLIHGLGEPLKTATGYISLLYMYLIMLVI